MKKPLVCLLKRLAVTFAIIPIVIYMTAGMPILAHAGEQHSDVVSKNPVEYTPQIVPTATVSLPHVDALGQIDDTIFAGGRFDLVSGPGAIQTYTRQNFFAFNANTGALKSEAGTGYTDPTFDGQIWAIATFGNSVYVGGTFSSVNGISRRRLVKINADTGAVDQAFNAKFPGGIVWDLKMWNGPGGATPMLIVAGSITNNLIALDPTTGANTNYFNLGIGGAIPGAVGPVSVNDIAINPDGTKLVATGNFQTVQGQSRTRLFVAGLTGSNATLDPWYYPGFAKPCASTHSFRIAYLKGVDFSPDGAYFVVVATGQIPKFKEDIWPTGAATYHTVCDAAARFNLSDDQRPVWINYTGGDSVYSTAVTGAAVYVQGHFEWLDNPNGTNSEDGGGAAQRFGVGAIDPVTGKALPWNPYAAARIGGMVILSTPAGLWFGYDSARFDGKPRQGIAFTPVPATLVGAGDIANCASSGDEATAQLLDDIPGTVFTLGDNAYQFGTASEFANCYNPSWGVHKDRTKPSPGERDYLTSAAAGYFNYFGASAGPANKGYYSYDIGHWHIIVLNSSRHLVGGCGGNSPMITWLRSDLAANSKKCTLAYFHQPLFSSGASGSSTKMLPAWNALYAARADVIISGHDNNYERFARQQPDGTLNNNRGIRQFVVGTGGAALRPLGVTKPNSEVRNADAFGVLKLKLHPASYEWQFIPQDGSAFIDAGSDRCS